jgi:hypothetical protein
MGPGVHIDRSEAQWRVEAGGDPHAFAKCRREKSRRLFRAREVAKIAMQTSGKPHEGWMTFIPLSVFILFVVAAMGGPVRFMNTLTYWLTDFVGFVIGWIRNL